MSNDKKTKWLDAAKRKVRSHVVDTVDIFSQPSYVKSIIRNNELASKRNFGPSGMSATKIKKKK
jgi:hypothetical protein